jgi:hypothetical protein
MEEKSGLSIEIRQEKDMYTYSIFYGLEEEESLFKVETTSPARNLLDIINFVDVFPANKDFFSLAEKQLGKTETLLLFSLFVTEGGSSEGYGVEDFALSIKKLTHSFLEEIRKVFSGQVRQRSFNICLMAQSNKESAGFSGLRSQGMKGFFENMMFLLYLEKNRLHQCQECGRFFIRKKFQGGALCYYQDTDGCTCIEKRSRRNVLARKKAHPILEEYRRRYKKNYMRVDRMIQRDKLNILPAQYPPFRAWQEKAGAYRRAYIKGQIDDRAFIRALDSLQDLDC